MDDKRKSKTIIFLIGLVLFSVFIFMVPKTEAGEYVEELITDEDSSTATIQIKNKTSAEMWCALIDETGEFEMMVDPHGISKWIVMHKPFEWMCLFKEQRFPVLTSE